MQNWTSLSNVSFGRRCNAVTAGKGERAITSPGAAVYLRVPSRHQSKWWRFLGKFANERIHAWNFSRLIGAKREIDWRRYLVYDNCPGILFPGKLFFFFFVCRYHVHLRMLSVALIPIPLERHVFRSAFRDEISMRFVVSVEPYFSLYVRLYFACVHGC